MHAQTDNVWRGKNTKLHMQVYNNFTIWEKLWEQEVPLVRHMHVGTIRVLARKRLISRGSPYSSHYNYHKNFVLNHINNACDKAIELGVYFHVLSRNLKILQN